MSADCRRGMATLLPRKVTACGPNQASYSITTMWLLPSMTSGPLSEANANAAAKRMTNAGKTGLIARLERRGIGNDNPACERKSWQYFLKIAANYGQERNDNPLCGRYTVLTRLVEVG